MTLIEVVVAVSIVALLMGILLPSVADAGRAARRVKCLANCRALAGA